MSFFVAGVGDGPQNADALMSTESAKKKSLSLYGADRWGAEFLSVNDEGHLSMKAPGLPQVDLHAVAELLRENGYPAPIVVRFPSMVERKMSALSSAFEQAIKDHECRGRHVGLYPLKVNQRRAVVEAVVEARSRVSYGLEAGSKPELLLAMAQDVYEGVPMVLNGFKDEEFMMMAHHAAELGHEVIIVLESLQEVDRYIAVTKGQNWKSVPRLGFRAKLYTRGTGRWQGSGGELAKFGLTTVEMLEVLRRLDDANLRDRMVLMHFHIGSQITQIKRIKRATREAIRLWAALRRECEGLNYLDIGGGIGVDYDGSKTSYESSANYDLNEYASQVVYEITTVCNELEVQHPVILTESGRVLVSDHTVTITDLREVQGELVELPPEEEGEDRNIQELRYVLENISVKQLEEYFHDAQDFRDEAINLFAGGHLSLRDRAKAEGLFHRIRVKAQELVRQMHKKPEEIVDYLDRAQRKYLANFSAFQSLPDSWAIDQVFPAAPLSRYGEPATVNASIVDITCDSDGCIKNFAHPDENLKWLPLHEPNGEAYYLGFFMTGAYQDSLANEHNLYSRCHEVLVHPGDFEAGVHSPGTVILEGDGVILEVRSGMTNEESLLAMDFEAQGLTTALRQRHAEADTTLGLTWPLGIMRGYPYLRTRTEVEDA